MFCAYWVPLEQNPHVGSILYCHMIQSNVNISSWLVCVSQVKVPRVTILFIATSESRYWRASWSHMWGYEFAMHGLTVGWFRSKWKRIEVTHLMVSWSSKVHLSRKILWCTREDTSTSTTKGNSKLILILTWEKRLLSLHVCLPLGGLVFLFVLYGKGRVLSPWAHY